MATSTPDRPATLTVHADYLEDVRNALVARGRQRRRRAPVDLIEKPAA